MRKKKHCANRKRDPRSLIVGCCHGIVTRAHVPMHTQVCILGRVAGPLSRWSRDPQNYESTWTRRNPVHPPPHTG